MNLHIYIHLQLNWSNISQSLVLVNGNAFNDGLRNVINAISKHTGETQFSAPI